MKNVIPILFTFDERLIMPACICICSLLQNADPDTFYDIFIIHSGQFDIKKTDVARIPEHFDNCRMNFRPIENEFVGAYEVRGITETCYYRMLAPEIITEYDKIIYTDVDEIFRDDMSKYYEIDLGTNCFGAIEIGTRFRPSVRKYVEKVLKQDVANGYYCSGNLLINLKQIREEGLCDRFRELAKNNYRQQDQDVINVACNGRFYTMPPAFGLSVTSYRMILNAKEKMLQCYSEEELDYAIRKGVIHFNGSKPWNTWSHHFDCWWEAYRKSPFFNERFYMEFFDIHQDEYDRLPLIKRIKILVRFFVYGRTRIISPLDF